MIHFDHSYKILTPSNPCALNTPVTALSFAKQYSKQSRPRIHQFIDGILDRFVEVLLAELDTDL